MRSVHGPVIQACAQRVLQEIALDGESIINGLLQELEELRQTEREDETGPARLRQLIQRQMDRKDRAPEVYLDGDITRSDMQCLVSRCDEEINKLREQMEEADRKKEGLAHKADRYAEIRALLEQKMTGGDVVLDEVIQRITVYPDYFLVEVAEFPGQFLVRAEGSGTVRNYKIKVLECTPMKDNRQ